MFSAIAENSAPPIWLFNFSLCFGMNLYNNKNMIKVATVKASSVPIVDNMLYRSDI